MKRVLSDDSEFSIKPKRMIIISTVIATTVSFRCSLIWTGTPSRNNQCQPKNEKYFETGGVQKNKEMNKKKIIIVGFCFIHDNLFTMLFLFTLIHSLCSLRQ
ncbi:hypothetical protein PRIPAC_75081 [Pristionchus pacificus]|nr:hypothetical protein PRIPAC_75081 [Pristionchus pacificus]